MAGPLRDNKQHHRSTHERWVAERNRVTDSDSPDDWWAEQCGICRYWLPLDGGWGLDWGVCSNPQGNFDGVVRFEHDGCEHHDAADEWIIPGQ